MVLPPVLLADLRRLTSGLDGAGHADDVAHALSCLVSQVRAAVSSYVGLQLTIVTHASPVTVTDYPQPTPAVTSLRIPLGPIIPRLDADSRLVLYATTPGAFVDLSADLGHALRVPTASPRSPPVDRSSPPGARAVIELDRDLPSTPPRPGLDGFDEFSTVNKAIGFLIGEGQLPEHVLGVLRRGAAAAGVDLHVFAAQVLGR